MSTFPLQFGGIEAAAATAATTIAVSSSSVFLGTDRFCLIFARVLCPVGVTVTGVASTGRLAGTTWVQVASYHPGAGQGSEIWVGYGVPDSESAATSAVTATYSASVSKRAIQVSWLRFGEPQGLPAIGASAGANGTSTSATAGALTPAVGDIVLWAHWHDANTAPTSYTDTPAAEPGHRIGAFQTSTAPAHRQDLHFRLATSAVAHERVFVIPSAVWVAQAVILTPDYPGAAVDGHTYKGRDLASLDTAGAL